MILAYRALVHIPTPPFSPDLSITFAPRTLSTRSPPAILDRLFAEPMPSQRQLNANRRNAQLSTGPRTPEGRAAVGLNALRHGLTAQTAVLPNESPEEFQELLDSFLAEYQPAGPTETLLVEQMVMAAWRLRRMRALETGLFDLRMSQLPRDENAAALDPSSRAFAYDASGSRAIESLSRYETRIERSFYRALHELERLRATSPENNSESQTHSHNRTPDPAPQPGPSVSTEPPETVDANLVQKPSEPTCPAPLPSCTPKHHSVAALAFGATERVLLDHQNACKNPQRSGDCLM